MASYFLPNNFDMTWLSGHMPNIFSTNHLSGLDAGFDVSILFSTKVYVAAILVIAIVTFCLIYLTGVGASKSLSTHTPGFSSNKSSSVPLTEVLIISSYVCLWAYIIYSTVYAAGVSSIFSSISTSTILFGATSVVITYVLVLIMVLFIRLFLTFVIYSVIVAVPVATICFFVVSLSPVAAATCIFVVVLATAVTYELFFDYLRHICNTIRSSSSVLLRNFIPISQMLLISTAIFSVQAFILYSFFKSGLELSFWDTILLLFALDWSWTIYQYFNKACMSSAIYLGLENRNDKSIFVQAFSASVSSFGAICSAAFVPSLLRTARKVIDWLYEKVSKITDDSWELRISKFIRYPLYVPQIILYVLSAVIGGLIFLFDFFNESFIPYVGIYGGRYNNDTARKAMKILGRSHTYQLLNLPQVKSTMSTWITVVFSFMLFMASRSMAPYFRVPELSIPTSLESLTSSEAIFVFCIILIYSFVQCMDAAIAAKVCHEYDAKLRETKDRRFTSIDMDRYSPSVGAYEYPGHKHAQSTSAYPRFEDIQHVISEKEDSTKDTFWAAPAA